MNSTALVLILAILAIAIAAFALYKSYADIPKARVTGLADIEATAVAANAMSIVNKANIKAINTQLGVVAVATTNFTTLAAAPVLPAFPLVLT